MIHFIAKMGQNLSVYEYSEHQSFMLRYSQNDPNRLLGWQYGLSSFRDLNGLSTRLFDRTDHLNISISQKIEYLVHSGMTICLARKLLLSLTTRLQNFRGKNRIRMMLSIIQRSHRLKPLPSIICTRQSLGCDGIYHQAIPNMSAILPSDGNLKIVVSEKYMPWEGGFNRFNSFADAEFFKKRTIKISLDALEFGGFNKSSIVFHSKHRMLIFGNNTNGDLRVCSFSKNFRIESISNLYLHSKPISHLMFKKDTDFFGTCSLDAMIMWKINDFNTRCVGTIHMDCASSFAFHPTENIIAIGTKDGFIFFYLMSWNYSRNECISTLHVQDGPVVSLSFHEGGRMLAISDIRDIRLLYMANDFSHAIRRTDLVKKDSDITDISFNGNRLTVKMIGSIEEYL